MDASVRLWDLQRATQTALLDGHSHTVNAVAFSPDGRTLASASADGSVQLWEPRDGSLIASVRLGTRVAALALHDCAIAVALDHAITYLLIVRPSCGVSP